MQISTYLAYLQKKKKSPLSLQISSYSVNILDYCLKDGWLHFALLDCMITCLWCLNYILSMCIIVFVLQEQLPCFEVHELHGKETTLSQEQVLYLVLKERQSKVSQNSSCSVSSKCFLAALWPLRKVQAGSYLFQSRSSIPNCHLHMPSA